MTIIDMSSVEKAGHESSSAKRKGRGKSSPGQPDLFAGLVREHGSRSTAKTTNHQARTALAEGHNKTGSDPAMPESKAEKKSDKQPSASDAAVATLLSHPQARSRVLADRAPSASSQGQLHASSSSRVASASVTSVRPEPLTPADSTPKAPRKAEVQGSQPSASASPSPSAKAARRGEDLAEGPVRPATDEASSRRARPAESGPRRGDEPAESPRAANTPAPASPAAQQRGRESGAAPISYPSLQVQAQALSATGPIPSGVVTTAPSVVMQASLLIERAAADRRPNAEIVLHPESLGRIQVQLQWDAAGSLSATVVAQSDSTAQLLAASAQDLHDSLSSAGLDITGLDVRADTRSLAEQREQAAASQGRNARVSLTPATDIAPTAETPRLGLIRGGSNLDLLA